MELYKEMYYKLFGALSDAIELLEKSKTAEAWELLITAQRRTEELYISFDSDK